MAAQALVSEEWGVRTEAALLSIWDFDVFEVVDLTKPTFLAALASIAFAPLMWNAVARFEHRTRLITRLCCGSAYVGCYLLALAIFLLQLEREWIFTVAVYDQPMFVEAAGALNQAVALLLFAFGSTLVLSSFWRLGITGTYLGDYFGILMEEKVTGFPFNAFAHPMYLGSVVNLASTALYKGSAAGLLLAAWSHLVYQVVSLRLEGPFTDQIYAARAQARAQAKAQPKAKAQPGSGPADAFPEGLAQALGGRAPAYARAQGAERGGRPRLEAQGARHALPHARVEGRPVLAPHPLRTRQRRRAGGDARAAAHRGVDVGAALVVGLGQHGHHRDQDLLHRLHRRPPLCAALVLRRILARRMQDRNAHFARRVHVGVPHVAGEGHGGRREGVVCGEDQLRRKDAARVRRLLRARNERLPAEEVLLVHRPRHNALHRVLAQVAVLLQQALERRR
eukprot:CAMPEP_0114621128 /NCGR_PEP_ID=MMETSP0168-20121206/9074_1 /TAXON_ID=95228 ORGANISM="Vannella sp., Strain DIVA3 517/6/12" /NCGR_SAMPLE_ID=MMETSP0168 /ASSEMBLY_ACC=CAM_ASM_000044 /LENGTH=451 /DNA_ID=CAMNT_0001832327 /DNA_START=9 /DNA_END=1362 /DNA_ORIENTATION=+